MLCEGMLSVFHYYFSASHSVGFFLFKWDPGKKEFCRLDVSSWQVRLWFLNNSLLLVKNVHLCINLWGAVKEGQAKKIIFLNVFFLSYTATQSINFFYWRIRDQLPVLYRRCRTFCTRAHKSYLHLHSHRDLPLEDDGLQGQMKMFGSVVIVLSICICLLSLGNPHATPFFAYWIPHQVLQQWTALHVLLSILEGYISGFVWVANMSMVMISPNIALLIGFWCDELNASCPPKQLSGRDSKLREFSESRDTYRQLQLLSGMLNECCAAHIANMITLAYFNQTSVNYGTIKLYEELPLGAYVAYPYLSVNGAFGVLQSHNLLCLPNSRSGPSIQSWRRVRAFSDLRSGRRRELRISRQWVRSCPPLRVGSYGGLKTVKSDSGIEWIDSLIDATVSLLLWQ